MVEFMDNSGDKHNVELLPCPFCGSVADIKSIGNYHTKSRKIEIKCSDKYKCGNKGFVVGALKHDFAFCVAHAVRRWNNRELNEQGEGDESNS